jgi:hypothetical protein
MKQTSEYNLPSIIFDHAFNYQSTFYDNISSLKMIISSIFVILHVYKSLSENIDKSHMHAIVKIILMTTI